MFSTFRSRPIPDSFDLREHIKLEVKNQRETEGCWAFSANSTVETNLALTNGEYNNFSERHLDYSTASNFLDGTNENALNRVTGMGGYATTAFTYYSNGSGPIVEDDMPFENNEYTISINQLPKESNVKKVDNMVYLPNIYKTRNENNELICVDANGNAYTDEEVESIRNQIKQHIMSYGAISTDVLSPKNYYNAETHAANVTDENIYSDHAVTIIGWDDNYSKENFIDKPSEDGAYIVLNSWGTEWGENGVYYVSYEDCLVERTLRGVTQVSDIDYDNLYQHDISEMWSYISLPLAANVFTAEEDEILTEIMIGGFSKQICDIYINPTGDSLTVNNLIKVASEVEINPGYTTIELDESIELTKGSKFAIVVNLINQDYTGIGVEDNSVGFSNAISNPNESFVSYDGINWMDIYDENYMMNLSIKAYTKSKKETVEIIELEYPNKLLFEGKGGEVTFKLKSSTSCNDKELAISIYNQETDVTEQFSIEKYKISKNLENVSVYVPTNIERGKYTIKVICESEVMTEETMQVSLYSFDTSKYMKVKFNDKNLYNAIKNNVLETDKIFAYLDDTQELILSRYIVELDFEGNKQINENVIFGKGYNISDLTGIESFQYLYRLILSGNPISDLKPIENMVNLQDLQLYYGLLRWSGIEYNNKIKNIEVIGNLVNLKRLDLTNCELEDISFVKNLYQIQSLDLQQNNIRDISALEKLTNLNYLCLDFNKIENIDKLKNLTNLNYLYLQENNIKDMNVIGKLSNLSNLYITSNYIEDARIVDEEVCNTEKGLKFELYMPGQKTNKEIRIDSQRNETIVEVPIIFNQACDEESNLYSPEGINLINCDWKEYGKTITITNNNYYAAMQIIGGPAFNSTFEVKIIDEIKEIAANIRKTEYLKGEELDLYAGGIKVIYESGREEFVPWNAEGVKIEGYDKTKVGEQTITVTYQGKTTKFTVNVLNVIEKIEIKELPKKTEYLKGEDLDLTGGIITVTYEDGTTEDIAMSSKSVKVSGYNKNVIGTQTVTITYRGYTLIFNVTNKLEEGTDITDIISYSYENKILGTKKAEEKEYIYGVDLGTKGTNVETFIKNSSIIGNDKNYTIKIYSSEDKELDGKKLVGTGNRIKVYSNNKLIKEYIIIYYGDTDGNGVINAIDALGIIKNKNGKVPFKDASYSEAGRVTGSSWLPSAVDALAVVKHATGKYTITQTR